MHTPPATLPTITTPRAAISDPPMSTRLHLLRRLDRDDHGAQIAEYAMLGGVSAVACVGIVELIRQGVLDAFIGGIISSLGDLVSGWF